MARSVIVDSGFLMALVRRDDNHHPWALELSGRFPAPWRTCEAVLSETFFLAGSAVRHKIAEALRRNLLVTDFSLATEQESVLTMMEKYADMPMSLADACLVRMTEILPDPVILSTDTDFHVYRRHSRQVVPCSMPRRPLR
jgi:predicted nucleic acid-binding protein